MLHGCPMYDDTNCLQSSRPEMSCLRPIADDAENVKLHVASREDVTVQG